MKINILIKGVVCDLTTSENYVSFTLIVNKGYRDNSHTIYIKCFAFKGVGESIVNADVQKCSRLSIVGELKNNHYEKDNVVYNCNTLIVHTWEFCPIVNNQTIIVDCIGNVVADINTNTNRTAGVLSLACNHTTSTGNVLCNFLNFKVFGDMINRLAKAGVNKGKALHLVGDLDRKTYIGKDNKKHIIDEIVLLSFDFVTFTKDDVSGAKEVQTETATLSEPRKVDSRIMKQTTSGKTKNAFIKNESKSKNNGTYIHLDMSGDLPF